MKLLDHEITQQIVDYSFGDHSGVLGGVPNAYMKKANTDNLEFKEAVKNHKGNIMTLFIDNIRLYRRSLEYSDWLHLKPISPTDREYLKKFEDESLLGLCSFFPEKKFIIFTAFEDTPLEEGIYQTLNFLPNVLAIHSANGVVFGGKVHPFPHGIERIMYEGYNHHEILKEKMEEKIEPTKLLFVAHRSDTGDRSKLGELFADKDWATVTHLPYEEYLEGMQKHKFVLCPSGNGIESARNWETLYMGRVPVFKKHPYLVEMFKDFPAVFVDDFSQITEELLNNYIKIPMDIDRNKLSLDYWFNKATK